MEAARAQESKTTANPARRTATAGPCFLGGRREANPLAALHRRLGNAASASWAHGALPALQRET
jgi:hypothetical protein